MAMLLWGERRVCLTSVRASYIIDHMFELLEGVSCRSSRSAPQIGEDRQDPTVVLRGRLESEFREDV